MKSFRVAASQYRLQPIADWQDFVDQVTDEVRTAADYGCKLLVLPEYFTLQLLTLGDMRKPVRTQLLALAERLPEFISLMQGLTRQHKIHIVAGTIPVRLKSKTVNRAYFFAPSGRYDSQSKIQMTRFEAEDWKITPEAKRPAGLKVFRTPFASIAIAICYDVEFPELVRAAAWAGAEVLVVPSCTDTRAGWWRVRACAQARAIENQIYVIQSCTVGGLRGLPAMHLNYGLASVLGPSDRHFSPDGVLAQGTAQQETLVFADLDLARLRDVRKNGSVRLYTDSLRLKHRVTSRRVTLR
jgi:predicted amidohydrolase